MNPTVSVIILNRNDKEYIVDCIRNVLKIRYPYFEIILVDDASTDGSLELVQKMFKGCPLLRIISLRKHVGRTNARNIGALAAKGELLFFLDSDTMVTENSLEELVKVMKKDIKIGGCQSIILAIDRKNTPIISSCFLDVYGYPYILRHIPRQIIQVSYLAGGAMLIRRELVLKLGMFDPYFYYGFEEADLFLRALLNDYKLYCVPSSIVYHPSTSSTLKKRLSKSQATYYFTRSHITLLIKNYQLYNILKFGFPYLIFLILEALYNLIPKRPGVTIAYFRALNDVVRDLRYILQKRSIVQGNIRKVPDKYLIEKGLLLKRCGFVDRIRYVLNKGRN